MAHEESKRVALQTAVSTLVYSEATHPQRLMIVPKDLDSQDLQLEPGIACTTSTARVIYSGGERVLGGFTPVRISNILVKKARMRRSTKSTDTLTRLREVPLVETSKYVDFMSASVHCAFMEQAIAGGRMPPPESFLTYWDAGSGCAWFTSKIETIVLASTGVWPSDVARMDRMSRLRTAWMHAVYFATIQRQRGAVYGLCEVTRPFASQGPLKRRVCTVTHDADTL